jgi:hypothetical protein
MFFASQTVVAQQRGSAIVVFRAEDIATAAGELLTVSASPGEFLVPPPPPPETGDAL